MNVKAISTPEDVTGITLGVIATLLLLTALIWSGIRVLHIEDTLRGVMLETAKSDFAGLYHPARRCRHADSGVPRLRR